MLNTILAEDQDIKKINTVRVIDYSSLDGHNHDVSFFCFTT